MFDRLKAQATAAAAQAQQAAKAAVDGAKERIEIAQAGKKMLDEGGPGVKAKLLAKHATQEATTRDNGWVYALNTVVQDYKSAAVKMKEAGALQTSDEAEAKRLQVFTNLGDEYEKRGAELEGVQAKLTEKTGRAEVPEPAQVSSAENDAISILTAKMKAAGLHDKVRGSFSGASGSAPESAAAGASVETNETAAASAETNEAPTASKSMMESMQAKMKATTDRAKERIDNANVGKKMIDTAGPDVVTQLLAKKASNDVTALDQKYVKHLEKTIAAYRDADSKMEEAMATCQNTDLAGEVSAAFDLLRPSYGLRISELQAILDSLSPVPEAIPVHETESDAIIYLTTQMSVHSATGTAAASLGSSAVQAHQTVVNKTLSPAVVSPDAKGAGKGYS